MVEAEDRKRIIEIIMDSAPYKEYQYNRSKNNYLAEWELHNIFYNIGIMKSNAQSVFLNREFGSSGQLFFEKISYGIYEFLFIG